MIPTQKINKVKGISEKRRLPRLGKIRLGVKTISEKTGKEYPQEVDYFVVPPEVAKVYGEKPREIDILVPVNDLSIVFPQAYKWYGETKGLKCIGDGTKAYRINENNTLTERECPCELLNNGCSLKAHLLVILPKVNMGGVYQIDIGSYNSIVDINSGLEYVELLVGRFAMVPLKLRRVVREIPYEGKLTTHYPLQVIFEGDVNLVNTLREENKRIIMATESIALPQIEDEEEILVIPENEEIKKNKETEDIKENEIQKPDIFIQTQASVNELQVSAQPAQPTNTKNIKLPTDSQIKTIRNILTRNKYSEDIVEVILSQIHTSKEASDLITNLIKKDFTLIDKIAKEILEAEEIDIPEEIETEEDDISEIEEEIK